MLDKFMAAPPPRSRCHAEHIRIRERGPSRKLPGINGRGVPTSPTPLSTGTEEQVVAHRQDSQKRTRRWPNR